MTAKDFLEYLDAVEELLSTATFDHVQEMRSDTYLGAQPRLRGLRSPAHVIVARVGQPPRHRRGPP